MSAPTELLLLRIEDIDMRQNRILFRASISKNKRDEYVSIPDAFKAIILESGILDYSSDHFIFGIDKPAVKNASRLYFYARNKEILAHLKYDKLVARHSLYSYKHAGAISLYKAKKDIKLLQYQCRHTSLDQTDRYLRDLALLTDHDRLKDWQGAA